MHTKLITQLQEAAGACGYANWANHVAALDKAVDEVVQYLESLEAPTEAEKLLAALVYFSPSYSVTVEGFAKVHQQACQYLKEHQVSFTPNQMRKIAEGKE